MTGNWRLRLLASPWVDRWCLFGLRRLFISSRAWAAAGNSNGDYRAFLADLEIDNPPDRYWENTLRPLLQQTVELRGRQDESNKRWQDTLFGPQGDPVTAERDRRQSSHRYWMQRWAYRRFALGHRIAPVKLIPVGVSETMAVATGPNLFQLPLPSGVEESRAINGIDGVKEYWLRLTQQGQPIFARVLEPSVVSATLPSLIYQHGLCMETEMLDLPDDTYRAWARAGLRLILPDAPGHNRRVTPGLYGGESFMQRPPLSGLLHLAQMAKEAARWIEWAHGRGSGKVALGGISMGALGTLVAAQQAPFWSKECRPDGLLMITPTAEISRLATNSAIARIACLDQAMQSWQEEDLIRLSAIVDAKAEPPLEPQYIVALLGKRDRVTPFAGGRHLAEKWRIPSDNLFVRDQGHFSAAFGLQVNWQPLSRLLQLLSL